MSEKPSLHEIAAMPYPKSMEAMRKHYDPRWHQDMGNAGELRTYSVSVAYSYRVNETETYEVEARSEEEAEAIAEDKFDEDCSIPHDVDIDDIVAEEIKP